MPTNWADFTSKPEFLGIGVLAFVAVASGAAAIFLYLRKRPSAAELERLRRLFINRTGKISDGEIVEFEGTSLVYSYSVGGVGYLASQDVSALQASLPADPALLLGPVCLKHDRRNPANSIVVCEEWSGLRAFRRQAQTDRAGDASTTREPASL